MKNKYRYRKDFQEVAEIMGIEDKTILAGYEDEVTHQPRFELTNNARRFVKGLLKLPLGEQARRLKEFRKIVYEVQTEEANKNVNG